MTDTELYESTFNDAIKEIRRRGEFPEVTRAIPTKPGFHDASVRHIIEWGGNGYLLAYKNNRGQGGFSIDTAKDARHDWKSSAYQGLTGKSEQGCLILADQHSCTIGVLLRYLDGNLTKDDMKEPIKVQIVKDQEEFLSIYQKRNAFRPHSTKCKLLNIDMAFGNMIFNNFLSYVNLPKTQTDPVVKTVCVSLAAILFAISESRPDINFTTQENWDFYNIYRLRTKTKSEINSWKGDLKLNVRLSYLKALVEHFEWYCEYVAIMQGHSFYTNDKTIRAEVKPMLGGPFFCWLMVQRMADLPLIKKASTLANKIITERAKIGLHARTLSHGSGAYQRSASKKLSALLCS